MESSEERSRTEIGRAVRARAQGRKEPGLRRALEDLDPALSDWTDEFIFGTVWTRPGLEFEERMLVAIAALATGGHIAQPRNYLHAALQDGIPPAKVHEVLVMLCVYAGFPPALNALACWKEVLAAHERASG